MYAQKDVTKFLGIPVDGTKTEMMNKLKAKGFVPSSYDSNILEGEFNGFDVNVYVVTNNNKVYRIMVCDKNTLDETSIKIKFNNLCRQFEKNSKYVSFEDYKIPESESISYEMLVNKKRYDAAFYQLPQSYDTVAIKNDIQPMLLEKYSEEELANPTEEIQADIVSMTLSYMATLLEKKTVWFTISEFKGGYYLSIYYENNYNRADDI